MALIRKQKKNCKQSVSVWHMSGTLDEIVNQPRKEEILMESEKIEGSVTFELHLNSWIAG